jgi:outer membrane beta-barrel protein/carboxypeptidase family protein
MLQKTFKISFILAVIALLLPVNILAQSIKGLITDEDNLPLEFVSVALLHPKDSLLVKYTSTGRDGKFELSEFKPGTYMFQVYLMTYQVNQRVIKVSDKQTNLGIIQLKKVVNKLNEITINAIIPIKIKQDTMSFNTKAFKVKQDDNVEDLIKKLPGIQVNPDGTVNAQGEDIKKILVDGKEFFNNDPAIALKNLNADAIKSVQIIDEESDDTRTTGIKDGEKTKIINLVLKKGKKSGYFGKLGGGIGTNDRYQSNFDINRFTKNTQLALFGKLNNINNTGATVFMRNGSRSNTNNGFLTTGTAGANYNYEIKKNYNFNVDYHYGYSNNRADETSKRTEFKNNTSFSSDKALESKNVSNNHNVNFSLRDRSVKGKYIEFRGNFKKDDRTSDATNKSVFFNEAGVENTNSDRTTTSNDSRSSGNLNYSYRKKVTDKGRNLRIRSGLSFYDNDDKNFQRSLNKFNVSDVANFRQTDEISNRDEKNKAFNFNVSIRYMEPIAPHHFISISSSIVNDDSSEDVNQTSSVNAVVETPLIYLLDYNKQTYNNQLGYVYSHDKFQFYISGGFENLKQKLDLDNSNVISKKYTNFLPKATISYEYKRGKRLRLRYNKSTNLPSLNQATPVINDFNPLYITTGNIGLTPELADNYNIMFYSHEFKRATSFFSFLNYTKTANAIVTNRTIDADYIQHASFENFGDKTSFRGMVYYSKKIKKVGLRYSLRISGNINDYNTIIDNAVNKTKSKSSSIGLSFTNNNKNKVDLTVGGNFDFDKTTFSLQSKDRNFFRQNYFTKFDIDITNSFSFNTQFDYSVYTDNNFASQSVPIWNMAIEYAFLKAKRGNLKLQVLDILDKDVGIVRTSSANYFEETFRTNLGTYAMISFTYSLKPPQGKSSKRGSGNRRHWRAH